MSEHTPLTEAERLSLERARWTAAHSAHLGDPVTAAVERIKADAYAAGLAARTSTATADTGLRERVEAELRSEDASAVLYGVTGTHPDSYGGVTKDEALECAGELLTRLRAILDATSAPTTDTGARDE